MKQILIYTLGILLGTAFFMTQNIAVYAECTGSSCPAATSNVTNQKNTTLYLREPILPAEKTIDVSVSQGSFGIMQQYVKMIYKYMLAAGSIIGILAIMYSGIQMILSAGESGPTGEAKKLIMSSIKGMAIMYLIGLILYVINPNFFTFGGGST